MMISMLVTCAALGQAPIAVAGSVANQVQAEVDPPDLLISPSGAVFRIDEDVFSFFALLNALGYAQETRHGGPPLEAPAFHPIRSKVRDALRGRQGDKALADLRAYLDKHPYPLGPYLQALLAPADAKLEGEAASLGDLKAILRKVEAGLELRTLFDLYVEDERNIAQGVRAESAHDFERASDRWGAAVRAPTHLVLIINPLDAHDVERSFSSGADRYVVVGANEEQARRAILSESLRGPIGEAIASDRRAAAKFEQGWDRLSKTSRARKQFKDGLSYLAETLASALAYRSVHPEVNAEGDEAFTEAEDARGLRWIRQGLAVVDEAKKSGAPLSKNLTKLLMHPGVAP